MMSPDVLERPGSPDAIDTVPPRDELLALLGHELRSPLTVIRNAVQLLHEKGDDEATRKWITSLLERQTQRLGCLLDDLLDFAVRPRQIATWQTADRSGPEHLQGGRNS